MALTLVNQTDVAFPLAGEPSDRIERSGVKAVINLFHKWELTDTDACILLGGISSATYNCWKRGEIGRIQKDLRSRLSLLLGIHKALRIIFREPERCYRWVRKENDVYGGLSALDIMKQGNLNDLLQVRQYLDSVTGT